MKRVQFSEFTSIASIAIKPQLKIIHLVKEEQGLIVFWTHAPLKVENTLNYVYSPFKQSFPHNSALIRLQTSFVKTFTIKKFFALGKNSEKILDFTSPGAAEVRLELTKIINKKNCHKNN